MKAILLDMYGVIVKQAGQFNSMDEIKRSKDFVCRDIICKGKLLYERKGA